MRVLQLLKIPYTTLPDCFTDSLKSPPHTTPPLQNPPIEQACQQRSPLQGYSLKSFPHTTRPLQNPPIEQAP
jgi:hypothetical protein